MSDGFVSGLRPFIHILMPRRCLQCAALLPEAVPLCRECCGILETCVIPAIELPGSTVEGRPVVATSYYRGGSPLRAVHRAAKYDQNVRCATWLATYLIEQLQIPEGVEACVPVPSHPARLMDRGLDVVRLLTEHLAGHLGCSFRPGMLIRTRLGTPQNELDRGHRLANVKAAFASGHDPGRPFRILLVDDVVTTGATLDACAALLEERGHTVHLAALAFRRELFGSDQR